MPNAKLYAHLQIHNDILSIAADALGISPEGISDVVMLKKGMTNKSFKFTADGNEYIMRIPGEGTDKLINRKNEASVYKAIAGLNLCDDPVYLDALNGFKITKYLHSVRSCDAKSHMDLVLCMKKLRDFHQLHIIVPHEFDITSQINFYEKLWNGAPSSFSDYTETKDHSLSLTTFIDAQNKDYCLTHIDAVSDNFLFYKDFDEKEKLQLTDWEYSGMQDPHVDIAMFCIYSLYTKKEIDNLIDIYFENNCPLQTRIKIYCYISQCGLLWSNWCEYKERLGEEFGEYSKWQYRYAKEYYAIAQKMLEEL